MAHPDPQYRRGVIMVSAATVVWSSAGVLARMVDIDPWTTLFWRSVYATIALSLYLLWRDGRAVPAGFARLGRAGVAMGVCFAVSMIAFIYGLSVTSVATALVFQAAAPLLAAALAFGFLGERVTRGKVAAIVVSFFGVLVIVGGAPDLGSLWAVAVSAACGLGYAITVVLARARPDVPTTEATVLALLIVGTTTAPFAMMSVSGGQMALLALFGTFQMGLGLILFTTGVRLIPAADAGLLSVLETVLGPVVVWAAFDEQPGMNTLLGGGIVIAAVVAVGIAERKSG